MAESRRAQLRTGRLVSIEMWSGLTCGSLSSVAPNMPDVRLLNQAAAAVVARLARTRTGSGPVILNGTRVLVSWPELWRTRRPQAALRARAQVFRSQRPARRHTSLLLPGSRCRGCWLRRRCVVAARSFSAKRAGNRQLGCDARVERDTNAKRADASLPRRALR